MENEKERKNKILVQLNITAVTNANINKKNDREQNTKDTNENRSWRQKTRGRRKCK